MKPIRTIYFFIFCLVSLSCLAQEERSKPIYEANQLKTSLVDIARGNPGLYWEHIFTDRTSIELGIGLTLDDWYSLRVYEGPEYIRRDNLFDTRFMGSFAYKFRPFEQFPKLFFGVEAKYRRYLFGNGHLFQHSDFFDGADRRETNTKVIFGSTWYPNSWNFLLEYYVGYGWFHSRSELNYALLVYDENGNTNQEVYKGTVIKDQGTFVVGLKIGYEFRK